MSAPGPRLSPLHHCLAALNASFTLVQGMPTALQLPDERPDLPVQLADASCLSRMGVKGAKAQSWLRDQGITTPDHINSWVRHDHHLLVARLARSEFFLEDVGQGGSVQRLSHSLAPASGITPVLRQDAALVLYGRLADEVLTQTCNVNFRAWAMDDHALVMTSMVGVSVLVLWEPYLGQPRYRIWCDPTFGPYLWETLLEIGRELGGNAVGLKRLLPEAASEIR